MKHFLPIGLGAASGFALKKTINWVDVDSFKINNNIFFLELLCPIPWVWSFINLPAFDGFIFSTITIALVGISIIDLFTMQIPLIFILIGLLAILLSIIKKSIYISYKQWFRRMEIYFRILEYLDLSFNVFFSNVLLHCNCFA